MIGLPLMRVLSKLLLCLALIVGLAGVSALPAEAATKRSVSASYSSAIPSTSAKITVSGKVSKTPKGYAVIIQRKSGSKWLTAKSTKTTSSKGAYKVSVTMPSTSAIYSYRAYAPKKGSRLAAASTPKSIDVRSRTTISLIPSANPVPSGSNLLLTGSITPIKNTTGLVTVQQLNGSTWTTLPGISLVNNGTGTYSKTITNFTANATFRASFPGSAGLAKAVSPSVAVAVGPAAPPVITTSTLPGGTIGTVYSGGLQTQGNQTGTWSLSPVLTTTISGLNIDPATGAITGTPGAGTAGTYNFTAGFTQMSTGQPAAPKAVSLTINNAPPVISTLSLPGGTQGTPYTSTFTATGNPPGLWAVTSGALPGGLTLTAGTGAIAGTPIASGTFNATFTFTQTSTSLTASKALSIVIAAVPPSITTGSLPVTSPGSSYSVQFTKTGGTGTWSRSGVLPAGITFPSTGLLSGTPTAKGTYSVTFTFTETSSGLTDSRALVLEVRDYIASTSLPGGSVGLPYSAQLQKNGNIAGTWSTLNLPAPSGLPGGLSLDPSTGVISGTPTTAGSSSFLFFTFTPNNSAFPPYETPQSVDLEIEGSMPAGPAVTKLSAGNQYACKIKTTGTLWCWGYNFKGQLGNGPVSGSNTKFPTPTQVGSATNWRSVATGAFYHTCAIKTDNTLWCMGYNNAGQLGNGSNSEASTPQQVGNLSTWESVSVGTAHTCAVRTDHTMWCWGAAAAIGIGPGGNALTPQQVGATSDWASVSSGAADHTCGVKINGELWCWGSNYRGQLGDGTTTNRLTPVHIGSTTWKSVSTGNGQTCGVRLTVDTLWCWGSNDQGEVGNGATGTDVLAPIQIGSGTWSSVSAGGSSGSAHTCAIKTTGSAWCWGYGASGQLGNGTVVDKSQPTQVDTTLTWSSISAGGTTSCGVKNDETQRCWGDGGSGEMGNGQLTPSPFHNPIPVQVDN